jgi:hypothetical protein
VRLGSVAAGAAGQAVLDQQLLVHRPEAAEAGGAGYAGYRVWMITQSAGSGGSKYVPLCRTP